MFYHCVGVRPKVERQEDLNSRQVQVRKQYYTEENIVLTYAIREGDLSSAVYVYIYVVDTLGMRGYIYLHRSATELGRCLVPSDYGASYKCYYSTTAVCALVCKRACLCVTYDDIMLINVLIGMQTAE